MPDNIARNNHTDVPSYDELPELAGLGMRHAWGVFGENDRVGTMNLLQPSVVVHAARLVTTGEVISLDLPLTLPDPPLFGREPYVHHVFPLNRHEFDDRVDNFHLQGSTQWDALGHVRCREFGFWGGRTENPSAGANDLGIDQWAERGIVGRGVLLDVAGWAEIRGNGFNALTPRTISADDLAATALAQGVTLEQGDILCVRTGWVGHYQELDANGRREYALNPVFAGLSGSETTARYLWDNHVAAIVKPARIAVSQSFRGFGEIGVRCGSARSIRRTLLARLLATTVRSFCLSSSDLNICLLLSRSLTRIE